MAVSPTSVIDPETGIPDLVRRLTDDSKRLAADELRLAKLEVHESVHSGVRGGLWLAMALGASIVALVALTVLLVSVVGVFTGANYWAGALVVGVVELIAGWMFVRNGLGSIKSSELSLPRSRASLADTASLVRRPTNH